MNAQPAKHFAIPPYRAELFNARSGWAGVMNANGVNCLTFPEKPGATITTMAHAVEIANQWNAQSAKGTA